MDASQQYDAETIVILRCALDDVFTDPRFLHRKSTSALQIAEHLLVYGEATAKALPHAIQVADRWHLMENASRAFLDAVRKSMRQIRTVIGATTINGHIAQMTALATGHLVPTICEYCQFVTAAVCLAMVPNSRTHTALPVSIPAGFSRAKTRRAAGPTGNES